MKIFIAILGLSLSIAAAAECPNLDGRYVCSGDKTTIILAKDPESQGLHFTHITPEGRPWIQITLSPKNNLWMHGKSEDIVCDSSTLTSNVSMWGDALWPATANRSLYQEIYSLDESKNLVIRTKYSAWLWDKLLESTDKTENCIRK